ncbi:Hypothetical protein ACI5QL_01036 [Bacillus velezensis]
MVGFAGIAPADDFRNENHCQLGFTQCCLPLCTTYYGESNGISFGKRCGK